MCWGPGLPLGLGSSPVSENSRIYMFSRSVVHWADSFGWVIRGKNYGEAERLSGEVGFSR